MSELVARAAVSHPRILWAAWLRVNAWYRLGNFAPQPELARWRLHPEHELRRLRDQLRTGEWTPKPWPQVPYPKKGACLRHYVMPSVVDQVAFMAYAVLLAPLLDSGFQSFVYGNRWYRPMIWNRRQSTPQWVHVPYPLLTSKTYRPYAQSFGLFRRVAHWTVAKMTDAPTPDHDYGGPVRRPDDYSREMLPPWTRQEWWATSSRRQACWLALDLQLAYPSVHLIELRDTMVTLLTRPKPDWSVSALRALVSGYPEPVLRILADPSDRAVLAKMFGDALTKVRIDDDQIGSAAWQPFHARPKLPPKKDVGLPTGLAISGLLLNVVLCATDQGLYDFLKTRRGDACGAVVRFADDVYLMSPTYDGLFDLTDVFWDHLSRNPRASLADRSSLTNLYLNLTKLRPDAVGETVKKFLAAHNWKRCENADGTCQEFKPPDSPTEYQTLGQWWRENKNDEVDSSLRPALDRARVGGADLGPFVTALVERLSEIGADSLADRFGSEAINRLARLHELARFAIDDEQVRADSRRTFAANRLVGAWLPFPDTTEAIDDIRGSVAHVLQHTPWKHTLWRAVVRASARRPHGKTSATARQDENEKARVWLVTQLRRIGWCATRGRDRALRDSWMHTWPEACADSGHDGTGGWRKLYLSFHRAAFWHALAEVLAELSRHVDERTKAEYAGPLPHRWTTRAMPDGCHEQMIKFLGALDTWSDVLYPGSPDDRRVDAFWELDQLCAAVLASSPASKVAKALLSCTEPSDLLAVPVSLGRPGLQTTIDLLDASGRVLRKREENGTSLGTESMAHIALAGRDRNLGQLLLPANGDSPIRAVKEMPTHAVIASLHLGCADDLDGELLGRVMYDLGRRNGPLPADLMDLLEYHRIRRLVMGQSTGVS